MEGQNLIREGRGMVYENGTKRLNRENIENDDEQLRICNLQQQTKQ